MCVYHHYTITESEWLVVETFSLLPTQTYNNNNPLNPLRMLFITAKLIKISPSVVSCSRGRDKWRERWRDVKEGRVRVLGALCFTGAEEEICVSWPMNSEPAAHPSSSAAAQSAHTVYFCLLTKTLSCGHFSLQEKLRLPLLAPLLMPIWLSTYWCHNN